MHYQKNLLTGSIPALAPASETDLWLIGIVAALILIGLLIGLTLFIHDFSDELRYLNMEIDRSEGAEREHYLRQRRKLWMSLIPFVRY